MSALARRTALAVLMLGIGLIHLLDLPGKWEETRWMGVAYLGLIAATVVCAEVLLRRGGALVMGVAAAVAAGPLAGFVLTRTTGLPGATDDIGNWGEPLGLASLFVEAAVVVLAGASFAGSSFAGRDGDALRDGGAAAVMPTPRRATDPARPSAPHAPGVSVPAGRSPRPTD